MVKKYYINVVEGSLIHREYLEKFKKRVLKNFGGRWGRLFKFEATLGQIKEIQEIMTKHYEDSSVPWYLDGYEMNNLNKVICAFGRDDGEGGNLFLFDREDATAYQNIKDYGVSKGIPLKQMDFLKVKY